MVGAAAGVTARSILFASSLPQWRAFCWRTNAQTVAFTSDLPLEVAGQSACLCRDDCQRICRRGKPCDQRRRQPIRNPVTGPEDVANELDHAETELARAIRAERRRPPKITNHATAVDVGQGEVTGYLHDTWKLAGIVICISVPNEFWELPSGSSPHAASPHSSKLHVTMHTITPSLSKMPTTSTTECAQSKSNT